MKNIDYKHIAFHTLVALYFIWIAVLSCLIVMALVSLFNSGDVMVGALFTEWIFLNLIMGTALFLVIRQFGKNKQLLGKIVFYSYFAMTAFCLTTVFMIKARA